MSVCLTKWRQEGDVTWLMPLKFIGARAWTEWYFYLNYRPRRHKSAHKETAKEKQWTGTALSILDTTSVKTRLWFFLLKKLVTTWYYRGSCQIYFSPNPAKMILAYLWSDSLGTLLKISLIPLWDNLFRRLGKATLQCSHLHEKSQFPHKNFKNLATWIMTYAIKIRL